MAWENKSVVITGGATGIGRYIALGAAEHGADVAVGDIDDSGLEAVDKELRAFGHKVVALKTDVHDESNARALIDSAAEEFGTVDYLVNNAGNRAAFPVGWSSLAGAAGHGLFVLVECPRDKHPRNISLF